MGLPARRIRMEPGGAVLEMVADFLSCQRRSLSLRPGVPLAIPPSTPPSPPAAGSPNGTRASAVASTGA
jgi:hypothetical protein